MTSEAQDGHIFTAEFQPATDFVDDTGTKPMRVRCSPMALRWCRDCKKQRRAKNMHCQVFYDGVYFFCKPDCRKD